MIAKYEKYKAFYDRKPNSIEGLFSIRRRNGEYLVEKVRARSGQSGWANTSWTRGKSPVPFGVHNLCTVPNNRGQVAGRTGIGEFFPVDNQGDRRTIVNPGNPDEERKEIGVHEENALRGSAGCIVIVVHAEWIIVRAVLRDISHEFPVIPLEVL